MNLTEGYGTWWERSEPKMTFEMPNPKNSNPYCLPMQCQFNLLG